MLCPRVLMSCVLQSQVFLSVSSALHCFSLFSRAILCGNFLKLKEDVFTSGPLLTRCEQINGCPIPPGLLGFLGNPPLNWSLQQQKFSSLKRSRGHIHKGRRVCGGMFTCAGKLGRMWVWDLKASHSWIMIIYCHYSAWRPSLVVLRTVQTQNEGTAPALKVSEENLPKGGWEQVWHVSINLMKLFTACV